MDEAAIVSHLVRALQTIMPGAGHVEQGWKEEAFLYAPHVLAVLPHLEAAGLSGSAGELHLRSSMGRFFSTMV